jgi:hypothetical protein
MKSRQTLCKNANLTIQRTLYSNENIGPGLPRLPTKVQFFKRLLSCNNMVSKYSSIVRDIPNLTFLKEVGTDMPYATLKRQFKQLIIYPPTTA